MAASEFFVLAAQTNTQGYFSRDDFHGWDACNGPNSKE